MIEIDATEDHPLAILDVELMVAGDTTTTITQEAAVEDEVAGTITVVGHVVILPSLHHGGVAIRLLSLAQAHQKHGKTQLLALARQSLPKLAKRAASEAMKRGSCIGPLGQGKHHKAPDHAKSQQCNEQWRKPACFHGAKYRPCRCFHDSAT